MSIISPVDNNMYMLIFQFQGGRGYPEIKVMLTYLMDLFDIPYTIDSFTADIIVDCRTLNEDQCYHMKRYTDIVWCWTERAQKWGYGMREFDREYGPVDLAVQYTWPPATNAETNPRRLTEYDAQGEFHRYQDGYRAVLRACNAQGNQDRTPHMLNSARRCLDIMHMLPRTETNRIALSLAVHRYDANVVTLSAPIRE